MRCADVMGTPAWSLEERFITFAGRKEHEDDLDRLIGEWTCQNDAWDLMRRLQEAGVPAAPVQSQSDMREDPQLNHRDFWQWLDHTEVGAMPYDGLQFLLSKTPGALRMPHAMIGEHNDLILREFVGLSDEEITDLIVEEVLENS